MPEPEVVLLFECPVCYYKDDRAYDADHPPQYAPHCIVCSETEMVPKRFVEEARGDPGRLPR
jgi:hypothetical protein